MLRVIDRYLIREIATPFLLALSVFTFLLMLPPLVEVAEGLIAKGVAPQTTIWIMVTLVPQALGVTIPMAFLVALLVALGRLSRDREAVALQACGVSPAALLRPILACSALAAAATIFTLVWLLPNANQSFRETTYSIIATRVQAEVKPRVFYEDFPGVILYVQDSTADSPIWSNVFLADTRSPGRPEIFVSEKGQVALNRLDRQVAIILENGVRHDVSPERPEDYEVHEFERIVMSLDPDTVFPRMGPQRGYPELTIAELENEVLDMRAAGLSPHRPIMEIHRKFSIPIACFVFALIGLAFGLSNRRDRRVSSFVVGIGVIFVYYVWMYVAEAAAKGALVSPHLAMWLPNLALGLPALFFVWRRVFTVDGRLLPQSWRSGSNRKLDSLSSGGRSITKSKAEPPKTRGKLLGPLLPRLNLLDQYVLRHYFKVVALAFVGMLGIFYIATFIDLSDKLFKGETTAATLLEYFWFATPQYIYYVLPISTLIATLVTIGLITRTSELVVMKACGISLYRVAAPLFCLGVVWSVLLFSLGETILASSNRRAEAIRHVVRGGSPQTFDVLNRKWIVAPDGSIYHYAYLDPALQELHGFSVYEFSDSTWALSRRTFVNKATFRDPWAGEGVWVRSFDASLDVMPYEYIGEADLSLQPPEFFVTEGPDAERMNFTQLQRYIGELEAGGFNVTELLVALQRKVSFPFITIVMTLIGIPFAVITGRYGAMYATGAGLAIAMGYWITLSVFAAVGAAGLLVPVLAAWAPNLLFGAAASYLLLTVRT